jgi:amidase
LAAAGGAAALLNFRPQQEATLARRLREAGAIIIGKTNLTEFADYVSDVMPSGFSGAGGTVKNPHTGEGYGRGLGSSVGSAAAVAASLAPVAIGSETQNSIQGPANASSVIGFKPSTGVVSRAGIIPLVPSQDSPGPLARSVEDAFLVTAILNGADCRDTAGMEWLLNFPSQPQGLDRRSLRIGVPRRVMADRADFEHVMPSFLSALAELRNAGVTVVDPCDLPSAEQIQDVRSSVFRTEFKAALNVFLRENAAPCGIDSIDALVRWNEAHPKAIPYGQSLLIAAQATTGLDDPQYREDRRRDIALTRAAGIDAAIKFAGVDALIAPMAAAAKCTGKAGAPALALPVGVDSRGAPFGVTLYSSRGKDIDLLRAGLTVFSIIGKRILPSL